ncbi:MAG: VWA domain-containing protein [Haliscomenobacter sp.]
MFRFEHPEYLYGLILAGVLPFLFYVGIRHRNQVLQRFGNLALAERLFSGYSPQRQWWKMALWTLGIVSLVLALANPQLGSKRELVKSEGIDVFIALDLSQSMLAEDLVPSRLSRAQRFGESLAQGLKGNKTGLIFFAGNAYLQVPLTMDYAAVGLFMQSAHPSQLPEQGTNIAAALALANRSFSPKDKTSKAVVLISDGENHEEDAMEAVQALRKSGAYVFTVGVGTSEGGLIPVEIEGRLDYKRDDSGAPVRTTFDEKLLRTLASEGKGAYYNLADGSEQALEFIRSRLDQLEKREMEQRVFSSFESYFQVFIGLAILLFMLEFLISARKKTAIALFLCLTVATVQGQGVHTLRREGDKAYNSKDYSSAEEHYRSALSKENVAAARYNLGNAVYQQKRFPEAVEHFSQAADRAQTPKDKAAAYYNLGNTYYQMQDFEKSIEAYKNALRQNPGDVSSKSNLELARQQWQRQQQQEQQQQQQQNQQNQQKDSADNQPQNKPSPQNQQKTQNPQSPQNEQSSSSGNGQALSQKEAEDLLRIAGEEEKKVQSKLRKSQGQPAKTKKDW